MSKWTTIPVGTRVTIEIAWRSFDSTSGPDAFTSLTEFPAGCVGWVSGVTNAGFRGIEHTVTVETGDAERPVRLAVGIAAADLTIVE